MNIQSVEILELRIPFRFNYGHARAQHRGVESILCIVRDEAGREGFGEAVPRPYVTGESTASIRHDLPRLIPRVLNGSTAYDAFRTGMAGIEPGGEGPVPGSALCALDTAVTDLVARQHACSTGQLLAADPLDELRYTASIGMGSNRKLKALLWLYKGLGFRRFKVKVGDEEDVRRIRVIQSMFGSEVHLFADANAAWDRETAAKKIDALAGHGIWAVEEPLCIAAEPRLTASGQLDRSAQLTDAHLQDNAWLQMRSPLPLIADESLISLEGARRIIEHQAFRIFNIRLSKCGGYLRSAQFAALAREAGLSFSLGAMVGESPVLAMAGTMFGASEPEHLYIQGHSHRVLHGACFAKGCPRLRRGGRLRWVHRAGTGLALDRKVLERMVVNRETVSC